MAALAHLARLVVQTAPTTAGMTLGATVASTAYACKIVHGSANDRAFERTIRRFLLREQLRHVTRDRPHRRAAPPQLLTDAAAFVASASPLFSLVGVTRYLALAHLNVEPRDLIDAAARATMRRIRGRHARSEAHIAR